MPLERHWERTSTPLYRLSRRERSVAIAGVVALCVSIVVLVLVTIGDKPAKVPPGCIGASVPGFMGGSNALDACGLRAKRLCTNHAKQGDAYSLAIEIACRRDGVS